MDVHGLAGVSNGGYALLGTVPYALHPNTQLLTKDPSLDYKLMTIRAFVMATGRERGGILMFSMAAFYGYLNFVMTCVSQVVPMEIYNPRFCDVSHLRNPRIHLCANPRRCITTMSLCIGIESQKKQTSCLLHIDVHIIAGVSGGVHEIRSLDATMYCTTWCTSLVFFCFFYFWVWIMSICAYIHVHIRHAFIEVRLLI